MWKNWKGQTWRILGRTIKKTSETKLTVGGNKDMTPEGFEREACLCRVHSRGNSTVDFGSIKRGWLTNIRAIQRQARKPQEVKFLLSVQTDLAVPVGSVFRRWSRVGVGGAGTVGLRDAIPTLQGLEKQLWPLASCLGSFLESSVESGSCVAHDPLQVFAS